MMKSVIIASLACSAAAFAPASNGRASTSLEASAKSKALPWLPNPSNLDGRIGANGFDPLGISEYFPVDYLVESEIKHGRVCMMAWAGYVAVDLGARIYPLPESMQGVTSATAHDPAVAFGSMGNMFIWIALFEMVGWIGLSQTLQGSGREPGDFGWGKQFMGKTQAEIDTMKLKELTNGRAAMLAFAGVVTQSVLYDKGFPYF
mmetsp:Transcript_17139/g.37170  ORF Transcript_17139/g.37170 Transcript_17139/m.37170 type:complete len:204 (-) Transcript_17139:332-943(-)